jgi:peptidoglycan/LPS O-acetylase OafA/YrhL
MIQRIQSIYLLLAAAANFSLIGLPMASAPNAFGDSLLTSADHIALLILFALGGGLAAIAIFLFKNRPLQSKISLGVAILALLAAIAAGSLYFPVAEAASPQIGAALLPVIIVLALLANARINKDEKLVRSMDRLR